MELIDKAALVAEIKRRLEKIANASSEDNRELSAIYGAQQFELINLALFINTLEVKDVDEQKERISECPYRKVGCTMYEGHILECKGVCSWVVDYPKLKELKAQKGE